MELNFPLILDGATGTQLQKRGYDGTDCAERSRYFLRQTSRGDSWT